MTAQSRVPAQNEGAATPAKVHAPSWLLQWFAPIVLLVMFCGFFFRAIFQGKPIAKLGVLQNVDALVNPSLKQSMFALGGDPSGFLIFFPHGHFAESMWSKFLLPLWNPHVGCGYPLFADPQSFIFSPAHLLGLFSSPQAYNAGLLLEVLLGMAGVYLLARRLQVSSWGSLLAASAFAFCPKNLFEVDLSGAECFFPWIMLSFVWLSERANLARCVLVGVLCGLLPYSSHPETAFFAVFFSAVLFFCLRTFRGKNGLFRGALRGLRELAITAVAAVAVSAPLVLPFVEFFNAAFFYKDAASSGPFIQAEYFIQSLFSAQGEASYFLGTAAVCMICLGASLRSASARAVSITLLLCLLICVPPSFLTGLLSHKPFSYIATLYGLPELLMLSAILAGFGLDVVAQGRMNKLRWLTLILTVVVVAGLLPFVMVYKAAHYPDSELMMRTLNALKPMMWALIGGSLATLIVALVGSFRKIPAAICAVVLIGVNFATEASIARTALPNRPRYDMVLPAELDILKSGDRFIATENNFFLPNTSANFAVNDFRSFSPLLPREYADFARAAGGKTHNLYFIDMPDTCSPLLDVAGVKYVITRMAVAEQGFKSNTHRKFIANIQPAKLADGLRVLGGELMQDEANSQIDVRVELKVHQNAAHRLALEWLILGENGNPVWSSPQKLVTGTEREQKLDAHVPVPVRIANGEQLLLGLQVVDTWTGQTVEPASSKSEQKCNATILGHFKKTVSPAVGPPHFKVLREVEGKFRIYENLRAVPQAYIVPELIDPEEHPLDGFIDGKFDPHRTALGGDRWSKPYERKSSSTTASVVAAPKPQPAHLESVRALPLDVQRPDCNSVLIKTNSAQDGYLVLTDLYYRGWECLVDGKPSGIRRVNHLYRAVHVPKGIHEVRFQFSPKALQSGLWVAVICLTSLWLVALWGRTRRRNVSRG